MPRVWGRALLGSVLTISAWARDFIHPGGLHTEVDFERMREKVAAGAHPWIDGWNALLQDPKSAVDYRSSPHPHMASRQRAQDDATAAYLNALRWRISGDGEHAACARRILNGWADTVKEVPHGRDQPGLSGIPIGSFALAAEVLRDDPEWSAAEQEKFKELLVKYFYPVCHDFLVNHRGAEDDKWWANWDICNMLALVAIGVYADAPAIFDEGIEYFHHGKGQGRLLHAVPYVHAGGLGQWQESGRDQAHVMGGMGLMAEMCQVAWNQGVDLFGAEGNRLLAAAESTAQFTLWKGVPYQFYTNSDQANQYCISENYHGRLDASHFELLYNHYGVRKGLEAPHVQRFAELRRPEPGEIDVFGYGTLVFTLDAERSPFPAVSPPPTPLDVRATAGLERVVLEWSPSGAMTTHGHEVFRRRVGEDRWESIHADRNWTTPHYLDRDVIPGRVYQYRVAARNGSGQSEPSAVVEAKPQGKEALPPGWVSEGTVAGYSPGEGGSFRVPAAPGMEGGVLTSWQGDFCFSARLVSWEKGVDRAGLWVRLPGEKDGKFAAVTTGEAGGRQARFWSRSERGGRQEQQRGCDYTWLPVWFRLQRQGAKLTASQSSNGVEWYEMGNATLAFPERVEVGFWVSGQPEGSALFCQSTLEAKTPQPPPSPEDLEVSVEGKNVQLRWRYEEEGTELAGFKIESSERGREFGEVADLPATAREFRSTGVQKPGDFRYRVRAYHRGGFSDAAEDSR
ncbi:hypothetical protein HNR46_003528 [Haloferula luteola]|uniref:Fibronectin type-III domain-containing protein n=1 Tax=Haloferula luteola TaxID=595692 RepID=A0A840V6I7_9BACT|nr:alginate lyase family protein [Haloferula luteola]MBB5353273.1 hypothetical protein [Haloferula luteola]